MRVQARRGASASQTLEGQRPGRFLKLTGVDGGRERTMRLLGLGLRVGDEVVVTHSRSGGVVVASATGRVAVGREMARHVRVEEVA